MGDPAGIGGELTLRAWQALRASGPAFLALDDPDRLRGLAASLGLPVPVIELADCAGAMAGFANALPVLPMRLASAVLPGHPDVTHAPAVIGSIERAAQFAQGGAVSAMVTNPINKAALHRAGFSYPGHTEFLAMLTGAAGREVMMLVSPALRVVLVTLHTSLRDAIEALSAARIAAVARTANSALRRDFGIAQPRLAIAGLNPHAGENGALGDEERTIIAPAIATLRAEGIDATGPFPPDTMFTRPARARYDAAVCMYHDQGLIPLKTLDMTHGVNVTLGLPIIRTSPDHGTAYNIAGKGVADPSSLIAAITLAAEFATRRCRALYGERANGMWSG